MSRLMEDASPLAFTVAEAVRVSGLGRSTIYALCAEGKLRRRCCGRRTLIMADDLRAFLASLPEPPIHRRKLNAAA